MAVNPFLRRSVGGNKARVARQSGNQIVVSAQRAIANGITDALGKSIPNVVKSFGEFLSKDRLRTQFQRANEDIARGAQIAYVNAYETRTPKRQAVYRTEGDKARLVGVLGPALDDPENIAETNSRRIALIDTVHMNKQAKHWQRLNFGSAEGRGQDPQAFPVPIGGKPVTQLQLPAMRGKAVLMPAGFWTRGGRDGEKIPYGEGSDDEFYPRTRVAQFRTRGIEAIQYLDKGIEYVADNVGPAYFDIFATEAQKNKSRLNKGLTYKVRADIRRSKFKI